MASRSTPGRRILGLPMLQGILPIDPSRTSTEVIAGVTLAAPGILEVMGYAKIAGTPVVTGPFTILPPIAVFAVLGSSRHLVVGADSARPCGSGCLPRRRVGCGRRLPAGGGGGRSAEHRRRR